MCVGRDSSVGSDSLRARRSGDRIPVGARFATRLEWPWGPPSLLYMSPGKKAAEAWR